MDNAQKARRMINLKTGFLMIVFGLVSFVILIWKLYDIQILQHDKLEKMAIDQQTYSSEVTANRGTIYDRNMNAIAISASAELVFIDPKNINSTESLKELKKEITPKQQAEIIAAGLAELLEMDYEKIYALTQKSSRYEIVARKVEKETADKIREFIADERLSTMIGLYPDSKRYYPYGSFASSIVGFVGTDNNGLMGLEAKYEDVLKGTPGETIVARDSSGNVMPMQFEMYYEATDGNDLVLTIDETIQHFLEKHMETALIENEVSKKAVGIVMDVKTGAILGMTTKGDFDLNEPFEIADKTEKARLEALQGTENYAQERNVILQGQWRNKAISDSYEPGSTFKIFTAAMAIEENLVSDNDTFNCTGVVNIGGWPIHCHKTSGHGIQTFLESLLHSCNPAFISIGQRVGAEKFYQYMEAFGFFDKTGVDIPGELGDYSSLHYTWDRFNAEVAAQASYSFGQTFKVTPLQVITAVSAVANGGNLMKPYMVEQMLDSNGDIIFSAEPTVVRNVISSETSKKLCLMLEEAVKSGTGSNAYVNGYRIAGKTGTSQKRDVKGAQENGWYVTSFVGFAPADDPQIAVLVMLDQPGGERVLRTGGYMAAPVARRIFSDVLPYIGVAPQYTAQTDITTPALKGLTVEEAKVMLTQDSIKYKIEGSGETVTDQLPMAGVQMPGTAQIILYTEGEKPDSKVIVPDVIGKTPEQANVVLTNAGLLMKAVGATVSGEIIHASWQDVSAGVEVALGTIVQVEFRNSKVEDLG